MKSQSFYRSFLIYFLYKVLHCNSSSCSGATPYLYSDSNCYSDCGSTVTTVGSDTHCTACPVYGYEGTCVSTCGAPLQTKSQNGYPVCYYPCNDANGEYAYMDGSCQTFCNYIPRTVGTHKFCDPCPTGQFWFTTLCISTCAFPLTPRTEFSSLYHTCDYPCNDANGEYSYMDGGCRTFCNYISRTLSIHKFCDPCPTGQFWFTTLCIPTCDFPLKPRTETFSSPYNTCDYPCNDALAEYVYKNSTCSTYCKFLPAMLSIHRFCNPCPSPLFFDGVSGCFANCNLPMRKIYEGGGFYQSCLYPCDATKKELLYNDGSCMSFCDFFPSVQGLNRYCNPCPNNMTLYYNRTCLPTSCSYPFRPRTDSEGYWACDHPCVNSSDYYYPAEELCYYRCRPPYAVQDFILCELNLTAEEVRELQIVIQVSDIAKSSLNLAPIVAQFLNPGNPGPFFMCMIAHFSSFVKYMNIGYSNKLQYMIDRQDEIGNLLNIYSSANPKLQAKFPSIWLPKKYEYYEISRSFFVNYWPTLCSLVLWMGIFVLFLIFESGLKDCGDFSSLVEKAKTSFKWNFIIMLFLTSCPDMAFSTSLEYMKVDLDSIYSIASFGVSLLINLLALFVFSRILVIVTYLWRSTTTSTRLRQSRVIFLVLRRFKNYKFIFESLQHRSKSQIMFVPLFVIKNYVSATLIAYLLEYPLAHSCASIVLSLALIIYYVLSRLFKSKLDLVFMLLQEFGLIYLNACIFSLAWIENKDYDDAKSMKKLIGDMIIYTEVVLYGIASIYSVLKILSCSGYLYKLIKNKIRTVKAPELNALQQTDNLTKEKISLPSTLQFDKSIFERSRKKNNHYDSELDLTPQERNKPKRIRMRGVQFTDDQSQYYSGFSNYLTRLKTKIRRRNYEKKAARINANRTFENILDGNETTMHDSTL